MNRARRKWLLPATGLMLTLGWAVADDLAARERRRSEAEPDPSDPEKGRIVRCVLPDRIIQQGRRQTRLVPQRPARITALQCEIRNGRYVAFDAASLQTALDLWSSRALAGDAEAQYYVGEIFQRGLGVPPDHKEAANWYRKAAEQGHERARMNLGFLYEKGLGVDQDVLQALKLYREGAGLTGAIAIDSYDQVIDLAEVERLRADAKRYQDEAAALRRKLEELEQQRDQAQSELEQARRREQELQADLEALESERRRLEGASEAERAESRRLREELAAAAEQVAALEARVAQGQAAVEQQRITVVRHDDSSRSLQARLARFEQPVTDRGRQIEVAAGSIAGPTILLTDPLHLRSSERLQLALDERQSRFLVGRVSTPAGLIRGFTVNGEPRQVSETGLFKVEIPTGPERRQIELAVVDAQGKDARLVIDILPEDEVEAREAEQIAAPFDAGPSYALVVANQHYQSLQPLETALNDGRRLAELLERRYGFRTRVLTDVTRAALLTALNRLQQDLGEEENLLIYYAGYGRPDEATGGGFWLPVDAVPSDRSTWVSLAEVTERLGEVAARHVLVVADSSFPDLLSRSAVPRLDTGLGPEARLAGLREIAAGRSRTALASGAEGPIAGPGGLSIFAAAVVEVLSANRGVLEARRLYDFVAAHVGFTAETLGLALAPSYAPMRLAGHEAGDFLFVALPRPDS